MEYTDIVVYLQAKNPPTWRQPIHGACSIPSRAAPNLQGRRAASRTAALFRPARHGFSVCGNVVAYALGDDNSSVGGEGIGLGCINTCLIGGGAGFGPVIGALLQWQQPHARAAGDYSLSELNIAFLPLTVCLVAAVVASLVVRETRCKGARYRSGT